MTERSFARALSCQRGCRFIPFLIPVLSLVWCWVRSAQSGILPRLHGGGGTGWMLCWAATVCYAMLCYCWVATVCYALLCYATGGQLRGPWPLRQHCCGRTVMVVFAPARPCMHMCVFSPYVQVHMDEDCVAIFQLHNLHTRSSKSGLQQEHKFFL